jgi:hypothetical protein
MSETGRSTLKSYLAAAGQVVLGLALAAAILYLLAKYLPEKPTPRHTCPYCGQEIKVSLEPNGKEKP